MSSWLLELGSMVGSVGTNVTTLDAGGCNQSFRLWWHLYLVWPNWPDIEKSLHCSERI